MVHKTLKKANVKPLGKVILESKHMKYELKTEYSTYLVVDNCFTLNNTRYYLQISYIGSGESIRKTVKRHAGYSWLIKKLYDNNAKTFSIFCVDKKHLQRAKDSIEIRRASLLIDIILLVSLEELEKQLLEKIIKIKSNTKTLTYK
ncbi:MAG: hypothetical protein ACTSQM_00880 [Candidatus Odinarchaeia archaeon]